MKKYLLMFLAAGLFTAALVLIPTEAGASQCAKAWRHADNATAEVCRTRGWIITPRVALTPRRDDGQRRIRYVDLRPCPTEDSRNCVWFADERGNNRGGSFVNLRGSIHFFWTAPHVIGE